ncbi:GNAT family N-acetyltransferase [Planococcus sp. YIM B11945]|uniref:GNAT family N-acetyltransferase n=1 Tax=Planococcus sp. YIM B11945 TaxID=3435410 RepID=UPI003D7D2E75
MAEIRKAKHEDSKAILAVMKDAEQSGYMLVNPGERNVAPEQFGGFIETINQKEKSGLFVACENDRILGYLMVQNEELQRVAHRAYLVIGVHSESRGKGIGRALFTYVLHWAKNKGLHRLDLTVIAYNHDAVELYKKMGFEVEGVKRDSLLVDGRYVDELYMSKLL